MIVPATPSTASHPLIDTVHIAGGAGPIYVVTAVDGNEATILFPESGETSTLPVEAVMADPVHT